MYVAYELTIERKWYVANPSPLLFYECPFEHHINEFRTEEEEEILFILCDACLVKKKVRVIIAFKALTTPHRESTKKSISPATSGAGKSISPGTSGAG